MTQAPHHASDEPKSKVIALAAQGYSGVAIGERLGVPARTAQRWLARWRELTPEEEYPELHNDWYRLTRRAQENLHTALDQMEEEESQLKHYSQIALQAGLGTDKIQKDKDGPQIGTQTNVQINIYQDKPVDRD